jgi:hypothetical protein
MRSTMLESCVLNYITTSILVNGVAVFGRPGAGAPPLAAPARPHKAEGLRLSHEIAYISMNSLSLHSYARL